MAQPAGDFTGLAQNYSRYRPAYAPLLVPALQGLLEKPWSSVDVVDVGAGTGIWTRMLAEQSPRSIIAIEPNDDMRHFGEADSQSLPIQWRNGSGEQTGLPDHCCDVVSMASSFHWVDFEAGTREFLRILRPGGLFCALWNPRLIEANPLLVEIENTLYEMAPFIQRVSSGRAEFTETLFEKLAGHPGFSEVVYLEGRHVVRQSQEQYLGVWWSVNDVRAQAGERIFSEFMRYVEGRIQGLPEIETTYLTRAWVAKGGD